MNAPFDALIVDIAEYIVDKPIESDEATHTAKLCLLDSLGCALMALKYPACQKHLGPVVPGAELLDGTRVPGTNYRLDPVQGAFNIGTLIRWLDYNDTWLAAEWGHPSDNFGGILALADYLSTLRIKNDEPPITMVEVLTWAIKAYEIQGILALENSFNRRGLDHVILVRIATTAVCTGMLGGNKTQVMNAVSNAWLDGGALRTYRHTPNTGSRKSWAAGDATSRGVRLALMAMSGEMGYASALTAPRWGFNEILYGGQNLVLSRPLDSYVMENILFKISFPAEFHAQTAIEAALELHPLLVNRLEEVETVTIETQEAGVRIIDKTGPLLNPADRDHCLQYMVAISLLSGRLTADDYEDKVAVDPRIDVLRDKMRVTENKRYSLDYLDPNKRSIANSVQVFFKDGSATKKVEVQYPLGHKIRRTEAMPILKRKYESSIEGYFSSQKEKSIKMMIGKMHESLNFPIGDFMCEFSLGVYRKHGDE